MSQVGRLLSINELHTIGPEIVAAARLTLVVRHLTERPDTVQKACQIDRRFTALDDIETCIAELGRENEGTRSRLSRRPTQNLGGLKQTPPCRGSRRSPPVRPYGPLITTGSRVMFTRSLTLVTA